jgi:hypothetical protein
MAKTYIGDLYGTASLDTRNYLTGLAMMSAKSRSAFTSIAGTMKKAIGGFIAVAAVRGMANLTTETMQTISALDKLSKTTGVAAVDLQAYSKASEFAGTTEMNLAKVFSELSKKRVDAIRGNRSLADTFQELGISVDQLQGSTSGSLFEDVVQSLGGIQSSTLRTSLAFKIFGKQAEEMNGLFITGTSAIAGAREEIDRTGAALSRYDLAANQVASGALAELSDAWGVFKQKLAVGLAPIVFQVSKLFTALLSNPEVMKKTLSAVGGAIDSLATMLVTLPSQVGIAWREVAVQLLEVKRLFSGGFTGINNPATDEAGERIARLRGEIDKLRESVNFTLTSNPTSFKKLVEDLEKDIGEIDGSVAKEISPAMVRLNQDIAGVNTAIEDGLTETLAEFVTTGKMGFKELGQAVLKEFVGALIRASIVTPLLGALRLGSGAGSGGILGAVFGGYKAGGGDVQAGKSYVVGERRPELFVPSTSGTILPDTSALRGGRGGDIYHIDARGADGAGLARLEGMIRALHGSIEPRALGAVRDANRRRMPGFA